MYHGGIMENFEFLSPTKIIFGRETQKRVGEIARQYSKKILLHYGGVSLKKSGLYDKIVNSLKDAGIEVYELGGVVPNPRLSLVKKGIKICRENNIKFILAVGGGSVIDSSKAIAMGVPYEGDVWDFYTDKAEVKEALGIGVVLTVPGAGSEASNGSVITNEDGWYKRAANSFLVIPKFAIMNPEITFTLPRETTAASSADIMMHVFERYFTNVKNVDFTDRLCEAVLKTIIVNLPIVLRDPENYNARAEIMWANTIAHNELLTTGRIGDWGSHMIEHEIGAIYDIPHGAGLTIVSPAWMKYVYKHDINRFVQFAIRVWNVDLEFGSFDAVALEGIRRMEMFFKECSLPVRLGDLDIPGDRLEEMAGKAVEFGEIGNFVKLGRKEVLDILNLSV